MFTLQNITRSLGFYIHIKRLAQVTKEACLNVVDYHDFLADIVSQAQANALIAGFTADAPLIALDEINLTQVQYGDIVEQIYSGVSFTALSLSNPPPVPVPIPQHASYFENYLAALDGDRRTNDDVGAIVTRMNEILSGRDADRQRVNGLVVGRVQSGKTRNYVGLMLKAVDEGWNLVIVLTSASTALADQTQSRIEKDFQKSQAWDAHYVNFRSKTPIPAPTALRSSNGVSFFWGVAMKQKDNLTRILDWLHDNRGLAPHMRVLVIDDEADNATPDSNAAARQLLTEGQIEDLVATIRDEDPGEWDYSDLADWVENLPSLVEGKMHEAAVDPGCKADGLIQDIRSYLDGPGSVAEKRNRLLNDGRFLGFLNMVPHPSDEDGHHMDVGQDAKLYFDRARGRGARSMAMFVKLLKTVFVVAEERSTISSLICKLIDRPLDARDYTFDFARCAYVAYTATPYACILNERPDETPLYADFIYSLELSPRYFGLDKIFGRDLNEPGPNMGIVDSISDEDVRFVLKPIQQIKDREIAPPAVLDVSAPDADLCYSCNNPLYSGAWDSMIRALSWAFCTAGARAWFRREKYIPKINARTDLDAEGKVKKLAEIDYRWTTMLVNVSQKQDSHERQKAAVWGYLNARCATAASRAAYLTQCEAVWADLTQSFTKAKFNQLFNVSGEGDDYGDVADYPSWSEIEGDVRHFLEHLVTNVHAIVINSANAENRDRQDFYNQVGSHAGELQGDHLWIVCGGNTISRGLTLTGLTTSYFDRVRKGVAVDTLTQMGRWFGYRADYELLPRLWMTAETVGELKKTAIVEYRMHESIRENFDAHYSPTDPEHYQQIYCWGRRLSGRARAQRQLTVGFGTNSSTDDLSLQAMQMKDVYDKATSFVASLGAQMPRPANVYRQYGQFPLWSNVDKAKIRDYLTSLIPSSTERSRQILRAILREIETTHDEDPDNLNWDVVIGEPSAAHCTGHFPMGIDRDVGSASQVSAPVKNQSIRYTSARSYQAYYAMIPTDVLNATDEDFVHCRLDDVVAEIEHKTALHNGMMPPAFATALASYPGVSLKARILSLLDDVRSDLRKEVPPCLRDCISEGVRNRSSGDYREEAHDRAGHRRPTLQLYLMTPPEEAGATDVPLIVHSFYWPDHIPDDFHAVAAGLPPKPTPQHPDAAAFGAAVAAVLSENDFPMTPGGGLRDQVIARLPHCDEDFFNQNIAGNQSQAPYAKVPNSDAYYHTAWAQDPIQKMREFVVDQAMEILGDHVPHEERDLATQIMAECPKLRTVYPLIRQRAGGHVLVSSKWHEAMTPAVVAAKGLVVVSERPMTYQLP